MLSIDFCLDLALILISTKLMGLLTRKIQLPQVVGALMAGLILGPALLNILHESDFIDKTAELGVIVLMFIAGLETDLAELKRTGKSSLTIAILGVVAPLLGGIAVMMFMGDSLQGVDSQDMLKNVFIGVVLTATSVSITVETLREMGKLRTPAGTAILGAAIIDDIIGIIILTIVMGFAGAEVNLMAILLRILLFFVFAIVCGIASYYMFKILATKYGKRRRIPIYGFVFCLLMAYIAERWFGIADITGAYLAGVIISNTSQSEYVMEKFEVMSYMLLSPIFFASIGIKTVLTGFNMTIAIFAVVLLIIALISKIVGCGLAAKLTGFSKKESLQIGCGMVSRGEVALIVADKGMGLDLMPESIFAPLILVVIVTTLITPVLLKFTFANKGEVTTS
jgi:Kef-type K+ transport system membrane component KefB